MVKVILYVHDAGVRGAACEQRVAKLVKGLASVGLTLPVEACAWGNVQGARFSRDGGSLPDTVPGMGSASSVMSRRDGALLDAAAPLCGDLLLYQTRGDAIRTFIEQKIRALGSGGVALLGHGLGGVACVDLLATQVLVPVEMLLTVGTAAPLLYELGALWGLPPGENLPLNFPKRWLNFYDCNDLLGCRAKPIFLADVIDHEVNSGQPFPAAHAAYFDNPQFWEKLKEALTA